MNNIKIYQKNGFKPTFATKKSSGIDILANSMIIIFNTNRGRIEHPLLKEEDLEKENKEDLVFQNLLTILNTNYINSIKIYNGYIEYGTGLRMILDGIDIKIFPKSSKYIKAPYLGSLQNDIGLIDEDYRGEVRVTYNIEQAIVEELKKYVEKRKVTFALETFAMNVYIPGERAVCQLVPPKDDYELIYLDKWSKEYEDTERGTGGHGSTNK